MAASEIRLLTATLSGTSNTPADVDVTDDGSEQSFRHADCEKKCKAC